MKNQAVTLLDEKPITIEPIAETGAAKWSYFSLVFSLFYFFNVIANFQHYSGTGLAGVFAVYVTFILLFLQATRLKGKAVVYPIVAIILLSAVGASLNPGTNALYGYAAFFSGYYFARKQATLLLALSLIAQFSSALLLDIFSPYYLGPSIACSLSLLVYGIFSRKEYFHLCTQLKKNEQIEQLAAIAERERIARDMHDLLGHSLSSLALKSELAGKLLDKNKVDMAKKEIAEVSQIARETLSEVRFAVTGLTHRGLSGSLKNLTRELTNMNFETSLNLKVNALPAIVESALILISKEWITNILRHSQADNVTITVNSDEESVKLTIRDNGENCIINAGNGINGMQSRVEELIGTLEINTENGVCLDVVIPLSSNAIVAVTDKEVISA